MSSNKDDHHAEYPAQETDQAFGSPVVKRRPSPTTNRSESAVKRRRLSLFSVHKEFWPSTHQKKKQQQQQQQRQIEEEEEENVASSSWSKQGPRRRLLSTRRAALSVGSYEDVSSSPTEDENDNNDCNNDNDNNNHKHHPVKDAMNAKKAKHQHLSSRRSNPKETAVPANAPASSSAPLPLSLVSTPKRPSNAYIFFFHEQRQRLLQERRNVTGREMGALIGKAWREMSSEDRQAYQDMEWHDQKRFQQEWHVYRQHQPQEQQEKEEKEAACLGTATGAPTSQKKRKHGPTKRDSTHPHHHTAGVKRPRGRPPKDAVWDPIHGQWIIKSMPQTWSVPNLTKKRTTTPIKATTKMTTKLTTTTTTTTTAHPRSTSSSSSSPSAMVEKWQVSTDKYNSTTPPQRTRSQSPPAQRLPPPPPQQQHDHPKSDLTVRTHATVVPPHDAAAITQNAAVPHERPSPPPRQRRRRSNQKPNRSLPESLVPVSSPTLNDRGTYTRPRGKPPKGYLWDEKQGLWILDPTTLMDHPEGNQPKQQTSTTTTTTTTTTNLETSSVSGKKENVPNSARHTTTHAPTASSKRSTTTAAAAAVVVVTTNSPDTSASRKKSNITKLTSRSSLEMLEDLPLVSDNGGKKRGRPKGSKNKVSAVDEHKEPPEKLPGKDPLEPSAPDVVEEDARPRRRAAAALPAAEATSKGSKHKKGLPNLVVEGPNTKGNRSAAEVARLVKQSAQRMTGRNGRSAQSQAPPPPPPPEPIMGGRTKLKTALSRLERTADVTAAASARASAAAAAASEHYHSKTCLTSPNVVAAAHVLGKLSGPAVVYTACGNCRGCLTLEDCGRCLPCKLKLVAPRSQAAAATESQGPTCVQRICVDPVLMQEQPPPPPPVQRRHSKPQILGKLHSLTRRTLPTSRNSSRVVEQDVDEDDSVVESLSDHGSYISAMSNNEDNDDDDDFESMHVVPTKLVATAGGGTRM